VNETVLLLGGGGFIGSHVAAAATAGGYRVRVFDRQVSPWVTLPSTAEVVIGDCADSMALRAALAGCMGVVQLISSSVPGDASPLGREVRDNVLPTLDLLDLLPETGVRSIVFASSGGTVYGDHGPAPITEGERLAPRCSHGVGKTVVEQCLAFHARTTGAAVTILRPSNPYGPGQSPMGRQGVIPIFMRKVSLGEEITLFYPVRDYVYVEDLAAAFVQAVGASGGLRVLNAGTGQGTSLESLVGLIESVVGRRARVARRDQRGCDVAANILATDGIRRTLGWRPQVDLATGLARTWSWLQGTL